jgi:hypothetical protein
MRMLIDVFRLGRMPSFSCSGRLEHHTKADARKDRRVSGQIKKAEAEGLRETIQACERICQQSYYQM